MRVSVRACVRACERACMCVRACVCVCVCERDRQRERERESAIFCSTDLRTSLNNNNPRKLCKFEVHGVRLPAIFPHWLSNSFARLTSSLLARLAPVTGVGVLGGGMRWGKVGGGGLGGGGCFERSTSLMTQLAGRDLDL